jgi:transposase
VTSTYVFEYKINMKHLTLEQKQVVRGIASRLFEEDLSNAEIGRTLGVSRQSVSGWFQIWKKEGAQGLTYQTPGPRSRLSKEQLNDVAAELLKGPKAHGYDTEVWTLARVADLIENMTGVRYHPSHVWQILKRMDWSSQKPERSSKQRDEDAITRWKYQTWPRIKKGHRIKEAL